MAADSVFPGDNEALSSSPVFNTPGRGVKTILLEIGYEVARKTGGIYTVRTQYDV
jgi:hypothetical protein